MRFNKEFSVCEVAGQSFLVPTGSKTMDVDKMMDLNETSLFILDLLKDKDMSFDEILQKVTDEFEVDEQTASSDLSEFVEKAKSLGVIIS